MLTFLLLLLTTTSSVNVCTDWTKPSAWPHKNGQTPWESRHHHNAGPSWDRNDRKQHNWMAPALKAPAWPNQKGGIWDSKLQRWVSIGRLVLGEGRHMGFCQRKKYFSFCGYLCDVQCVSVAGYIEDGMTNCVVICPVVTCQRDAIYRIMLEHLSSITRG